MSDFTKMLSAVEIAHTAHAEIEHAETVVEIATAVTLAAGNFGRELQSIFKGVVINERKALGKEKS